MSERPGTLLTLSDRIFGIIIVGLGLLIVFGSRELVTWDESGPGPRMVPLFASIVLMVFGAATAVSGDSPAKQESSTFLRLAIYLTLLLICIALFSRIGAAAAFVLFFVLELRLVEKYSIVRACIVSVVTVGILYLVFSTGLSLRLPQFPFFR